jgi:hypothetical protein
MMIEKVWDGISEKAGWLFGMGGVKKLGDGRGLTSFE